MDKTKNAIKNVNEALRAVARSEFLNEIDIKIS